MYTELTTNRAPHATHATLEKFWAYTRRLRSAAKRDYARRYAVWMTDGEQGDEPRRVPLSNMAAQGVRLDVAEIIRQDAWYKARQAMRTAAPEANNDETPAPAEPQQPECICDRQGPDGGLACYCEAHPGQPVVALA